MPDQEEPAPQLRSWTRQGIDASAVIAAANAAVEAAVRAEAAAAAARVAADEALAAAAGGGGGGGVGNIYPTTIIGTTQVGRDLMVAPGLNYAAQQASARNIIAALGADYQPTRTQITGFSTFMQQFLAAQSQGDALSLLNISNNNLDEIDVDTDGVPYLGPGVD